MTRADGHATMLSLMYDTYNLLSLFVKKWGSAIHVMLAHQFLWYC